MTNERYGPDRQLVNPPCLVMGTNAVLKVSVKGPDQGEGRFTASNIVWSVVQGNVQRLETVVSNEVSYAMVEPSDTNDEVIVEARFNDDAIQPRFRLPVFNPRIIPIRVFIVEPPLGPSKESPWQQNAIEKDIENANEVFSQIGVAFNLLSVSNIVGRGDFWNLHVDVDVFGSIIPQGALQDLVDTHKKQDSIELYFVGSFSEPETLAFHAPEGIVLNKKAVGTSMAHELGHALGLADAFHGYCNSGQIDVPGGVVVSLDSHSLTNATIYVPVGIDHVSKTNEEVLTR